MSTGRKQQHLATSPKSWIFYWEYLQEAADLILKLSILKKSSILGLISRHRWEIERLPEWILPKDRYTFLEIRELASTRIQAIKKADGLLTCWMWRLQWWLSSSPTYQRQLRWIIFSRVHLIFSKLFTFLFLLLFFVSFYFLEIVLGCFCLD